MAKEQVTFSDIAKHTGFSKTTISRYFNDPDSLTPANQKIVAKALVELGYHENKIARVLANGKTEFVGIIIPTMFFDYYSEMVNCLLRSYEQYGYKFLVFVGSGNKDEERQYIKELMSYKIEGMIILSHTLPSSELAAYDVPIVTIEREDKHVSSVNTDNYMGGMQATSLLAKNGCDVLIHVNTFVARSTPSYGRIKGFQDICAEHNLPNELVLRKFRGEYEEMSCMMKEVYDYVEEKYPDMRKGLFLANDTYANIMLNIIMRKYGGFPDSYRIVGFDNSPIAREAVIPISTIGQRIETLATEAMDVLVTEIERRRKRNPGPASAPIHRKLAPVLIERETTDAGVRKTIQIP